MIHTNGYATDLCSDLCYNKATCVECSTQNCKVGVQCSNRDIQVGAYPPVEVFQTLTRGCGLRIVSVVTKGTKLIEYIGEYMKMKAFKQQQDVTAPIYAIETGTLSLIGLTAQRLSVLMTYVYCLGAITGTGFVIDATRYGNQARFINHACYPNSRAEKWFVLNTPRIIIVANRDLQPNTEITINYGQLQAVSNSFVCLCGSPKCKQSI